MLLFTFQAKEMANILGATACYYSSALTQKGLKQAFDGCIKAALMPYMPVMKKNNKNCLLQ